MLTVGIKSKKRGIGNVQKRIFRRANMEGIEGWIDFGFLVGNRKGSANPERFLL